MLILGFQKAVAVGSQWHARRGKVRHGVANVPGCAGCHGYAGGMCGSNECLQHTAGLFGATSRASCSGAGIAKKVRSWRRPKNASGLS